MTQNNAKEFIEKLLDLLIANQKCLDGSLKRTRGNGEVLIRENIYTFFVNYINQHRSEWE